MKKLLAIGGIIVIIFALIVVLSKQSDKENMKDNPYGKDDLDQATKQLIGNENYNNIVLPEELAEKVASGDDVTAYFFSSTCGYCIEMTPILMPIANELDEEVLQYNVLEFNEEAAPYAITSTPTLIHYKDGMEVGRMEGLQPEENIRLFFEEFSS